jgi:hypothetical protein
MSSNQNSFRSASIRRRALRTAGLAGLLAGAVVLTSERAAHAAPPETMPIWRAQLTVRTCNTANAGTNNPVFASLNTSNSTALDYGRNDFPVNNTFTYDLVMNGVSRLSDVTRLRVSKTGTDGLSICRLDLRLNNQLIFTRTFPATGAGRLFLDGGGGTVSSTITGAAMRESNTWQNYVMPFPPFVLPRAELESRIEALTGTRISGQVVRWGHLEGARFVEETRVNASTMHFDLDLELNTRAAINSLSFLSAVSATLNFIDDFIAVSLPNTEVDVDFNVAVSCANGQLDFNAGAASVDVDTFPAINLPAIPVPGLAEAVDFVEDKLNELVDFSEDLVEGRLGITAIENGFAAGLNNISFGTSTPICPDITVQQNGDVAFSL